MHKVDSDIEPAMAVETLDNRPGRGIRSFLSRHRMLLALTFIFTINALDRQILLILLEDIKLELGLSDSQLGLLTGFAFVAIYVTLGLPAAHLADRKGRSRIIAIALAIWSVMTVFCGMAHSYATLLLARCGVGVGEAGCTPAAHSMIADVYPRHQRATALSIYGSGYFIGAFVGFALGGWIAQAYGWRMAFIAVGAPGILIAGLVWAFMRDPARHHQGASSHRESGFWESIGAIWRIGAFRWYVGGGSIAAFAAYGMMTWLPALLIREYGLQKSDIGAILGLISGAGGFSAAIGFGMLADRLGQRDRRWNLWLASVLFALCAPATAAAFLSGNATWTLFYYAIPAAFSAAFTAPIINITQQIVPSNLHAMVTAVIFLVFNVVGFGLGPLAVGFMSDLLAPRLGEALALRRALLWLCLPFAVAAVMLYVGARRLPDERLAGS